MVNLEEGEKIIRVVRKHWFVMLVIAVTMFILALLPLFLYFFLFFEVFNEFFGLNLAVSRELLTSVLTAVQKWGTFAYPLWLLILWTFFFVEWTDYYLDALVITNKRVIDIEQKGFFNREITSFNYHNIQDITVETKGIIQTLFKFGFIHIETAGDDKHRIIAIKYAQNPEEARSVILQQQSKMTDQLT